MSTTNDAFIRSVALEKAVSIAHIIGQDQVVEYADMFRKFLAGGEPATVAEPEKPRRASFVEDPNLPVFKVPRAWDGFTYYQFSGSDILYRADLSYGSDAPGSVERINAKHELSWSPVTAGHLNTRTKIREKEGYEVVSAVQAAKVIRRALRDAVRFE